MLPTSVSLSVSLFQGGGAITHIKEFLQFF